MPVTLDPITQKGTACSCQRIKMSLPKEPGPAPPATNLGLLPNGLGLWEATSPRSVVDRTRVRFPGVLRANGAREIAAGLGIRSTDRPAFWLWNRVEGDALDLATIVAAHAQARGDDHRKTLEAVAAVLDVLCVGEHGCAAERFTTRNVSPTPSATGRNP